MQIAVDFPLPIKPDGVLSPEVIIDGHSTALYFITNDDKFGRITFNNLDAIRVCRGEEFPYPDSQDPESGKPYQWAKIVQHSEWQKERYAYEAKHYGDCYEFGGDVNDMLTNFKHYIFSFHDEFVEVIARGIWFEKSDTSLKGQPLAADHPAQPLPPLQVEKIEQHGITGFIRWNTKTIEQLKHDCQYHMQKLMEFRVNEDQGYADYTLMLEQQNNQQLVCKLLSFFGKTMATFATIATLDDIKPYLTNHLQEVASQRAKS